MTLCYRMLGKKKRKALMDKVLLAKPAGASVDAVAVLIDNQSGDLKVASSVLKHSKVRLLAVFPWCVYLSVDGNGGCAGWHDDSKL